MTFAVVSSLSPWTFRVRYPPNNTSETSEYQATAVVAYTSSWSREVLYWGLSVITLGFFPLLVYWFPALGHFVRYRKTTDIFTSTRLVAISEAGRSFIVPCRKVKVSESELMRALPSFARSNNDLGVNNEVTVVLFEYRCCQFILNIWSNEFEVLSFNLDLYPSEIHTRYSNGVPSSQVLKYRQKLYGAACVDVPISPLIRLIFSEIFHPFYAFQAAAICLWFWDEYYQYAGTIIAITLISLCAELLETRLSQIKLQKMAKFVCNVSTLRQNNTSGPFSSSTIRNMESITSTQLVPGDVVAVCHKMTLPCDILLLRESVIVNESMLTGESTPVMKCPLPNLDKKDETRRFDVTMDSRHVLFGGTEVLGLCTAGQESQLLFHELEPHAVGLVIRTGFCTTQGQMMRSILHPKGSRRSDFKYETYKYLGVLAGLATIGAFLSLIMTVCQGLHLNVIIIRFLDTFTSAIPPALPATMTVGSSIAVTRLKRLWNIMCIAPSRINYAGQVNTFVFDKTGTLTEKGLELKGVLVSKPRMHSSPDGDPVENGLSGTYIDSFTLSSLKSEPIDLPQSILAAMASCHSVGLIGDDLTGDPMEVQLLTYTEWVLVSYPISCPQIENDHRSDYLNSLDRHLPCLAEVVHYPKQHSNFRDINQDSSILRLSAQPRSVEASYASNHSPHGDRTKYLGLLRIVRRFEFVPALQRMSVIVWDRQRLQLHVYCKGSPEELRRLCIPSSVPVDFTEKLQHYTESGMRVLAVASKRIPLDEEWVSASNYSKELCNKLNGYSRAKVEQKLTFNGLIVFANSLKPNSRLAMSQLLDSGCRCIMATGDNALTAAAVSHDVGLLHSDSTPVIIGDVLKTTGQATNENLQTTEVPKIVWALINHSANSAHLDGSRNLKKQGVNHNLTCKDLPYLGCTNSNGHKASSENSADAGVATTAGSEIESVKSLDSVGDQEVAISDRTGGSDTVENEDLVESSCQYFLGKDPREIQLVLTGPAFRLLKKYHEVLDFKWSHGVLDSRIVDRYSGKTNNSCDAKKTANTCHRTICEGLEKKKKKKKNETVMAFCSSHEISAREDEELKSNQLLRERMTLQIDVSEEIKDHSSSRAVTSTFGVDECSSNSIGDISQAITILHDLEACSNDIDEKTAHPICSQTPVVNSEEKNHGVIKHVEMSLFEYCLRFCRVYARMSPDDKATLVASLQSLPYQPLIGMCGDGANDCGALTTADVGVSLSEKEASIAAPFLSTNRTILSVVDVLREGRAALTNSFQSFKFITLSALVQLLMITALYYYGCNFTDAQYLWIDLVVTLPLGMTMAWTNASRTLSVQLPMRKLVGFPVILSIIGQVLVQLIFLNCCLFLVSSMDFYRRFIPDKELEHFDADDLAGYENTTILLMSNFQFITLNMTLCMGKPWRKHSFTNWPHTTIFLVLLTLSVLMLLVPYETVPPLAEWLSIIQTPLSFRLALAELILLNSLVTFCFERYIVVGWAVRKAAIVDRPSHVIDMILPIDRQQKIQFVKSSITSLAAADNIFMEAGKI